MRAPDPIETADTADPSAPAPAAEAGAPLAAAHPRQGLLLLSLTALGIVYGDIGTSPLYALRECFAGHHPLPVTAANVLGVLSLVIWALVLIISVKYMVFILRADNRGEGGILVLTALVTPTRAGARGGTPYLILLGLFGAALLYGDGIITPAVSVLSAVEGLGVATPLFEPYIVPITIAILVVLFAFQKHGTARVGVVFGPVMVVWFGVLALLGLLHFFDAPEVLAAFNPYHAVTFFARNGWHGFLVLGSVFLVVTGGEAIYADMGHFGPRPIRRAWFALVLPALVLHYLGQGALLLTDPSAAEHPFYRMAPAWALYPLVVLATMATVIASQAVISGAYSLTMQAIQLGYLPRMDIAHTSEKAYGQIYMPVINWALMAACILLVVGFETASNLAAAYGVAVTTTMVITTLLFYQVERRVWRWKPLPALLLTGLFLTAEAGFFGANILKVPQGGWFPLVAGLAVFVVMTTWKDGRALLWERLQEGTLPLDLFLDDLRKRPVMRVPGTAVFMTGNREVTPVALLHSLKHMKVLHERVVMLTVTTREVPHVPPGERAEARELAQGLYQIVLSYGFMETPDVPADLRRVRLSGLSFKRTGTTYFLGRERILATHRPGMMQWRERLFAWISQNARSATSFYNLPPERVVELGAQIEL